MFFFTKNAFLKLDFLNKKRQDKNVKIMAMSIPGILSCVLF